jgi:DNA-binding response OmpR family regulator
VACWKGQARPKGNRRAADVPLLSVRAAYTARVAGPTTRASVNGRATVAPRRKVVLVLEDHASVGGLIAGLLRQEGYRAVRAWDPQEALRLARGRSPDLVLLDLNLPYPNGLDVLRQVRNNEATRRAPIVLVSGGELNLSTDDAALVAGVVRKPFDIDVMLNEVRKALGDPVVEVQPRQYDAQDYFLHGY